MDLVVKNLVTIPLAALEGMLRHYGHLVVTVRTRRKTIDGSIEPEDNPKHMVRAKQLVVRLQDGVTKKKIKIHSITEIEIA